MKPLNLDDNAPWKQRFRVPVVPITQIAQRNPSRGLAFTNRSGIYQLHAWDVESGDLQQRTDQPAGVVFGGISPDGNYIYYLRDNQGDELGHFVRVPFEGGTAEDLTPDLPPYASYLISQSLDGRMIGLTTADATGFKMLLLPVDEQGRLGALRTLYHSQRMSFGPLLSYHGEYGVIATTERSQHTDRALMAFDLSSSAAEQTVRILQEDGGSIQPVAFSPVPGDTRLLATTDVTGFDRPLIWDVKTGDRIDFPMVGMDGDLQAWDWSPDGERLLLCQYVQATYQLYVYDVTRSTLTKLEHPNGSYQGGYFYDLETIFVTRQDAVTPHHVVALDAATGEQKRVVLEAGGDVPAGRPWRSVSFPGAEGHSIQAWVATPEGDGPFPTILHTHGGPTAVETETFFPSAQAWLDHGFAFLSVNYHGSVTFGRQFEHSILGRLGQLEVEDMAAAYRWLVAQGIAIPDAVLLTGGSYGGYLTLLAMGKRPDLWAGGMAQVAIADWALMYEDQAETLRGYQRSLFGGTPDELPEAHATSSPVTYTEHYRSPVLVIQGENDTRCPSRQMHVFESKMRELGHDITIHWFDAGHGSRAMEQSIEHQELMLRWAYRILG